MTLLAFSDNTETWKSFTNEDKLVVDMKSTRFFYFFFVFKQTRDGIVIFENVQKLKCLNREFGNMLGYL